MPASDLVEERRKEFFTNVWDHTADAFQSQFDRPEALSPTELLALNAIVEALKRGASDDELSRLIRRQIADSKEDLMGLLLQLVGSTRSKIITDLKAKTANGTGRNAIRIPSSYRELHRSDLAWPAAGQYIVERLRAVLSPLADGSLEGALEALNQATHSGFIRQERAKRQGHEAERRLAALLLACEIPFEPQEKATNALCPDVQLQGVSFDVVVPSIRTPRVCVKATVHTSNIGQYGESKDHLEVDEARTLIRSLPQSKRPTLLVLIDGVGFNSNSAGLNGVLEKSDEFCQFKTIWKGIVIAAASMEMKLALELPTASKRSHEGFLRRWGYWDLVVAPGTLTATNSVAAGEARIQIP